MGLYDKDCKTAKPRHKPYKLSDGQGLYLEVTPNGSKLWRLRYRYLGKEKSISLGRYPLVTLADARDKCFEARKLLDKDIDPSAVRQERRRSTLRDAENSFKAVALEWYKNQAERWSEGYRLRILHLLETDIFPAIGAMPIKNIEAPDLLAALRKIEQRGALELARKARQICSQVFRYGIPTGRCKEDVTVHLRGVLKTRKTKHCAAIETKEIPELLEALERNDAGLYDRTLRAIKLSLLTFQRPGEIRQAEKTEIDWDARQWVPPPQRMKMRRSHIVPLSRQALEVLEEQFEEIERLNTQFIFPSQIRPKEPMSDNTVRVALHRLGFKGRMTAHGFRALARTTIREVLDYAPDVIEAQLAHKPPGPLGEAYDRATFLKQRTVMMQAWADYLDTVAATGQVDVEVLATETAQGGNETRIQSFPVQSGQSIGTGTGSYRIVYLNYPQEGK